MTEAEETPKDEEPDTPEEEVPFPDIVAEAGALAGLRRMIKDLEDAEEKQRAKVLHLMQQVSQLHGIRLRNGDAVRRTWSVRATKKVDPARLRELMADADRYIREEVDLPSLRKDYPSVWERAGAVKRTETVAVRLSPAERRDTK